MFPLQKILVTGAGGQLGNELRDLAALHPSLPFVFFTRNELPLDDAQAITDRIAEEHPDFVVNCAAYTAVDKAESERESAFLINADAVGTMASACAKAGAQFIHISTDYVFDGTRRDPLREDDAVSPINVYGESKLAGERAAMAANPASVIIRTSWVYSHHGKNFVKTMMRLMGERDRIAVVNDQWGSATYAKDLAAAVLDIVQAPVWHPGIYHFSNEGVITWFDFAKEIAALLKSPCGVQPTTTASFPTPARRPLYSVMDKTRIQQQYGIALRPWKDALSECISKLKSTPQV